MHTTPCIQTYGLTKKYQQQTALDQVSVEIPSGVIFALLGPNGAGKTTLIRILTQLGLPDSGLIQYKGEPLAPKHKHSFAYLPEERGLYKRMRVSEHLIYLARLQGVSASKAKENTQYWLKKLDLSDRSNSEIGTLSKGNQQKIQFIATLVHDPEIIILDEPFSGFDPVNAELVKNEILELKKKGKTIILSTHRMESVEEFCSHMALINHGKVMVQGEINNIKATYDDDVYVVTVNGTLPKQDKTFESNLIKQVSDKYTYEIKPISINNTDLFCRLSENAEILSFAKKEISIKELFIQMVQSC